MEAMWASGGGPQNGRRQTEVTKINTPQSQITQSDKVITVRCCWVQSAAAPAKKASLILKWAGLSLQRSPAVSPLTQSITLSHQAFRYWGTIFLNRSKQMMEAGWQPDVSAEACSDWKSVWTWPDNKMTLTLEPRGRFISPLQDFQ